MDTKQQLYLLLFRGILFAFPVWSGSDLLPGLSTEGPDLSELSTQRSFVLSRICIFSGNDSNDARYVDQKLYISGFFVYPVINYLLFDSGLPAYHLSVSMGTVTVIVWRL